MKYRLPKQKAVKFKNATFHLKHGEEITIRMCTMEDIPELVSSIREYLSYAKYIPRLPEEFNPSLEEYQEVVSSFIEQENSLLLLATFEDRIIGNIDFTGNSRKIMQHTAVIGMGLLSEWQNRGVGTLLMEAGLAWAKQNPVLEKLWLQVYSTNIAGLRLYKKMGFQENGIIENFFKYNNVYVDNIIMSLDVDIR